MRIPVNVKIISLCLFGATLMGCVPKYSQSIPAASAATIHAVDPHVGYGSNNFFAWHSSQDCKRMQGEGRIASLHLLRKSEDFAMVQAGRRGFLLAHRHGISDIRGAVGGGSEIVNSVCRRVVSFVPRAGATYKVHMSDLPSCEIFVIDQATGVSPKDLEQHEVTGRCTQEL